MLEGTLKLIIEENGLSDFDVAQAVTFPSLSDKSQAGSVCVCHRVL